MYQVRYQVYIQQQFVLLPLWSTAGTPILPLYEKGDAVRIEPRPLTPSTCRLLCAGSSRTLFRPQASGDGTDAERARRVESIVSALIVG